jgi:hypothetical protein
MLQRVSALSTPYADSEATLSSRACLLLALASNIAGQANVGFGGEQRTWPERAGSDAIDPKPT